MADLYHPSLAVVTAFGSLAESVGIWNQLPPAQRQEATLSDDQKRLEHTAHRMKLWGGHWARMASLLVFLPFLNQAYLLKEGWRSLALMGALPAATLCLPVVSSLLKVQAGGRRNTFTHKIGQFLTWPDRLCMGTTRISHFILMVLLAFRSTGMGMQGRALFFGSSATLTALPLITRVYRFFVWNSGEAE